MMRRIILPLLCSLFSIASFSQNSFIVTGKVFDAATQQPLTGASVFAQNTTLGTATDASGNFTLYLPNGGYDLIVTYSGMQTESYRVSVNEPHSDLQFNLKLKEKEMEEVSVVATNEVKDGWDKYGGFFKDNFIGQTQLSNAATILNPEVLHFYFSKRRNRLKVVSAEPLMIENKALGYKISYALDSFVHEYGSGATLYTGSPLFEELEPENFDQKMAWATARREAYAGSMLHFMRSVYNKNMKEQGFEVQFIVRMNDNDKALQLKDPYGALHYTKDDSLNTVEIHPNQLNVGVIFNKEKPAAAYTASHEGEPADFQFSTLVFPKGVSIIIEENGYFYNQDDITVNGYWTWDKVANLLPYDYVPL